MHTAPGMQCAVPMSMRILYESRLGTYICDLPASDMKKVDEALAKTMGLIGYYADLNKKLSDKLTYISKIKAERNTAQDTLKEIYSVLGLEETGDTTELLDYLKNHIDTKQ